MPPILDYRPPLTHAYIPSTLEELKLDDSTEPTLTRQLPPILDYSEPPLTHAYIPSTNNSSNKSVDDSTTNLATEPTRQLTEAFPPILYSDLSTNNSSNPPSFNNSSPINRVKVKKTKKVNSEQQSKRQQRMNRRIKCSCGQEMNYSSWVNKHGKKKSGNCDKFTDIPAESEEESSHLPEEAESSFYNSSNNDLDDVHLLFENPYNNFWSTLSNPDMQSSNINPPSFNNSSNNVISDDLLFLEEILDDGTSN